MPDSVRKSPILPGVATLSGTAVGLLQDGTARPMAGVIAVSAVIAILAHTLWVPKDEATERQA